jgi:hypothetical protein
VLAGTYRALAVSLYSLVPRVNSGIPSLILGVFGLLFTGGAIRSVLTSRATRRQQLGQLSLVGMLVLIFGTELVPGIIVLTRPVPATAAQVIGIALVTSLIVGIARARDLVGERDTGLTASIAALTGRSLGPAGLDERDDAGLAGDPAGPGESGPAAR